MKYISKKEIYDKNINIIYAKINNMLFINKELKNTKKILDDIKGYPLDINQREAVITDEDNILLIAGAGSGKTLTIIGKVKYLIEVLKINENDILCISFTNDCVNNLKNNLSNYNVDICTFHKLAFDILKSNNKNISICNDNLLEYIIDEFFFTYIGNKKILYTENYKNIKNLIITFINLFKSSNYNINYFDELFNKIKYSNEYILLRIIKYVYVTYQLELKSTMKVDFNDMINRAVDIVKNNGNIKKYKYIIIDEYQDTSIVKYNLITEIKRRTNAKLFAVGDDYQSIYRFSGCTLNIFLKFNKYYKYSKILKITNTYRNSNELIDVAGKFIMKNKNQIYKRLKSNKNINKPIVIIYTSNIKKVLYKLINSINTNILLLGRNNNDINEYFTIDNNGYINERLRYLTVHKSKGLEEDNVIIINLKNEVLGFPSKIESNSIIKYVLNEKDSYPYEEERRLFYVALTRTKNKVYLLVNRNNQSIFVKELIKNYSSNIQIINELI